jgi:putative flippase GtrA
MKIVTKQFIKFGIIGCSNTAIDFFVYYFLTRYFSYFSDHKLFTVCLAFIIANINSYFFNKYWTFQDKTKNLHTQYLKFFVISLIGLGINMLIFDILIYYSVYDLLAKVLPIPVVIVWNFLANKLWTFKK